jgi:hypothetical protein
MNKKLLSILWLIVPSILCSCAVSNNDSSQASTSLSNFESNSWNESLSYKMFVSIGEDLPYIDEFTSDPEYYFRTDNNGTPYINPYIQNPKSDLSEKYKKSALNLNYIFYSDSEEDNTTWHYYRKAKNKDTYIEMKFAYYTNEGMTYFDVYSYLNKPGGALPIPTTSSYKIEASLFGSSYVNKSFDFENAGATIFTNYVLTNTAVALQFNKGHGLIYNDDPINPLKYIYLENPNNTNYIQIYGGKSPDELNLLPTFNNVYYLANFVYFKIVCPSNGKSFTCQSIWFINNNI